MLFDVYLFYYLCSLKVKVRIACPVHRPLSSLDMFIQGSEFGNWLLAKIGCKDGCTPLQAKAGPEMRTHYQPVTKTAVDTATPKPDIPLLRIIYFLFF